MHIIMKMANCTFSFCLLNLTGCVLFFDISLYSFHVMITQQLYIYAQVLENADSHFKVGSGHWVTVTGRTNRDDFDLTVAGL